MKDHTLARVGYYDPNTCDLAEFRDLVSQTTSPNDVPLASDVQSNVPIYDVPSLQAQLADPDGRRILMTEWADVFMQGAGVVVLKTAYANTTTIDTATQIFNRIIEDEKAVSGGGADHFAAAGANDRLWNALQKLCQAAPEVHLEYFANPAIAAACEAWLGPNYQMTAQVNLVHPGGQAQQPHRDYHLGFQPSEVSARYPAHVHALSPLMTLQGGIAHCDMPVESGPTKLLPFSQAYAPGYVAWRRDDFRALFEERYVQIPLAKGDAVFFNPAMLHAAGANTTSDIHRFANLLQVSSAMGRATESVDRRAMCKALYPHAQAAITEGRLSAAELSAAIAATAEGYSFPTNLDTDPPVGGLAPESQQAFFHRALAENMDVSAFCDHLDAMAQKRIA